jgi:hypothetical protein
MNHFMTQNPVGGKESRLIYEISDQQVFFIDRILAYAGEKSIN